ncbi:MAG: ABC transporter ATP-binding protein [Phycisphaerales bacterium]
MGSVSLQNIGKTYPGGIAAVGDLSLDIADGEFVVLVGPSGCGKSTTLRLVAGLEDASSGAIFIGGRDVTGVHPRDRDIAMVFQNYALYPHMSVHENMAFGLRMRRVPKADIDRRVRDAARTLEIEDLLRRRPRELSGGQRQRVALGRAIVREPQAFLFDEPLSNLDAALRVSTRGELKALHQRLRTTTIHVTHDQEEAMTLGDRIAVLHRGRLQQAGPPLDVYARPVNRFVAGFIGTPAMNFIEGSLEPGSPGPAFRERGTGDTTRIPLSAPAREKLAPWVGRDIVLGVRPQALAEIGPGVAPTVALSVRVVEPLGDMMDVIGQTPAGTRLVARIPARAGVTPASQLTLTVNPLKVHCFEPGDAGRNLLFA